MSRKRLATEQLRHVDVNKISSKHAIKIQCVEYTIGEMIRQKFITKDEAVELIDNCDFLEECGRYDAGKGKLPIPIMPSNLPPDTKILRTQISIAYAIIYSHGLPISIERYDKLKKEGEEKVNECIEVCVEYNPDLIQEKGTVNLHALEDKYLLKSQGNYPKLSDVFECQHPEVAKAIKFIQSYNKFTQHIKRKKRLHTISRPFYANTGRCQYPFNKIYDGPLLVLSKQMRLIIDPEADIWVVDITSADMAVVAALSNDVAMQEDYKSDDIYMAFIDRIDLDIDRDLAKILLLGITKGMTAWGISQRAGISEEEAQELLDIISEHYHVYMAWADEEAGYGYNEDDDKIIVDKNKVLSAPYGITNGTIIKSRSFKNRINSSKSFRAQAYGSAILYRTVVEATKEHLVIVGTLHDSIYVQGEEAAQRVAELFTESSSYFLNGFELKTTIERCN